MLDDLRNSSSFLDEEEQKPEEQAARRPVARRRQKKFLGLTAQQRFLLSLALFVMVCLLGSFALVISGSVALPF